METGRSQLTPKNKGEFCGAVFRFFGLGYEIFGLSCCTCIHTGSFASRISKFLGLDKLSF
jgi:hypothetical protein